MKQITTAAALFFLTMIFVGTRANAQSPVGPITPTPNTPIQQAPPESQAKVKVQVSLVNTPVTVRDSKGQMIHDLDPNEFVVTDNGVPQKITHFDIGGDPISLVILLETS